MSENTAIEWTHFPGLKGATWNPMAGCKVVSPGCTNCYAMRHAARLARCGVKKYDGLTIETKAGPVWNGNVSIDNKALMLPLRTRERTMFFVDSMSDLFYEGFSDEHIDRVFAVMALCPHHVFQILTKRAERMRRYMIGVNLTADRADAINDAIERIAPPHLRDRKIEYEEWPLGNVWLGVSVEDQSRAQERVPKLLSTLATVRFLSCEPLLEPLDLTDWLFNDRQRIDWVIVGGESGGGARELVLPWVFNLVEACQLADVPVFVKQLGRRPLLDRFAMHRPLALKHPKGGDPSEWPEALRVREFPKYQLPQVDA